MKSVRAMVIAGNGTNCEREVANACRLVGAECDIVHIAELLAGRRRLDDYHLLNLAGGFLDGDDLGSAKAGANRLQHAVSPAPAKPWPISCSASSRRAS
jgi:phosphoribosylformylglycinamidine synthase